MENPPPTVPPIAPLPPQTPYQPAPQKTGMGTGAKVGIGCGAIFLLMIIGAIVAAVFVGGQVKEFAEEAQANPTRAAANIAVKASMGQLELVAEDDVNKRYTLKEKGNGNLTTFYWDASKNTVGNVNGDFSAIPSNTATEEPTPTPEPGAPSSPEQVR